MIRTITALLLVMLALIPAWAQTDEDTETPSLVEAALRGPAVASILDSPRETPAQQLQAIFLLLDLGETDVAQLLWNEFSTADLAAEEKAELVSTLGTARFLSLARRGAANDLAGVREFAASCLQAAAEAKSDPARLSELLAALDNDAAEVRAAARSDLAVTGDVGARACLQTLAKAQSKRLRTELLLTLGRMRPGVEPMLIAVLTDGRGQFRRDIVELVGYLHLQDAVPWLAALATGLDDDSEVVAAAHAALSKMGLSTPDVPAARAVVLHEIHRLESHDESQLQLPDFDTTWWSYDAEQRTLSAREVTAEEKQVLRVARLARMLGQLPSASAADRRLALLYGYQVSEVAGLPLSPEHSQWASELGVLEVTEMLHEALESNQISAAIACTNLLAKRGDFAALTSVGGQRSPLARALIHPDRALRFAALEAVMKISPPDSFAGASGVPAALWFFAAGAGTPQAVVASSNVAQASDWAGQIRGVGFDATPVTTGRDALLTALNLPRLELLLLDSDIGRPPLREVVFGFRSNPALARVPVAVLSSLDNLSRAEQLATIDPWLIATPRPQGNEAMESVLAQLAELSRSRPTEEQRTEQADAALRWIAALLEAGHPYDELLRGSKLLSETLYQPDLQESVLKVLTVLGTADSQQILLDYLSLPTLPIESRRAAAEAFSASVERFGKLLTSEELLRQYDRYNASASADSETQEVLGGVLDVLEK